MKKHNENVFAHKFRLLSSQESEEISWSSSESSDCENIPSNKDKVCNFLKKTSRKRKRKQAVHRNISNLDITVIDVSKEPKSEVNLDKSQNAKKIPAPNNSVMTSPILGSTQYFLPYKCSNDAGSPILASKTLEHQSKQNRTVKSPILILKTASPKISPNVRKKLFKRNERTKHDEDIDNSSVILNQNQCLDRRKSDKKENNALNHIEKCIIASRNDYQEILQDSRRNGDCKQKEKLPFNKTFIIKEEETSFSENYKLESPDLSPDIKTEACLIHETPELNMDDSIAMLKTSSSDLAKKVKSYFDNHFSSENLSQQTISEVSTPKNSSKTSDDVEIISFPTQALTNKNSFDSNKEVDISTDNIKKDKKIRYKKDGLAYRLNNLLKKQTASVSLWQHERFLAVNSNFVIPKMEFVAFRICNVHFKYGCQLLEAKDFNDDNYFILINCCYYNDNISTDCVVKIYEPYTKVDFVDNCKLLINVTKFECVTMKK